jgi:hypothetical protein
MNINLHIERLILDGVPFETRNRTLLQSAIETELVRLLTENNIASNWQTGGAMPDMRADAIQLAPQHTPAQLGRQIAGSIYGGIDKAV